MIGLCRSLYTHRELVGILVAKQLKLRYRGSGLGFLWTLLNPLLQMFVYTLVFSVYFRLDMEKYPAFLFAGLLPWTRLCCHRFRANEVRLLLGVIAYYLGNLLRRLVLPLAIQGWSLTSLQQRLFKTSERLIWHARYFVLQLAERRLTQRLFRQIVRPIERLAWHPT